MPVDPSPKPTTPKEFKKPVAWLLGRQLISSFKSIALYAAFGDKLDPKDWMHAKPICFTEKDCQDGAFWFDFFADSGDGQMATYGIAYMCLSDLWAADDAPARGAEVEFERPEPKAGDGSTEEPQEPYKLPRGSFLFVGGDTSYHIADYQTLANRFQNPFRWAFASRVADLQNQGSPDEAEALGQEDNRRPLLGIPGNHDYYDSLDGFNRQFRRPLDIEDAQASEQNEGPQLSIPCFKRQQEASYIALSLPFDWSFLGIDAQAGKVDRRQQGFFRHYLDKTKPEKLIVSTPEPSTVFGKYLKDTSDEKKLDPHIKTYRRLGLEASFLEEKDGDIGSLRCRLDIAGDVHHYARYWGPADPERARDASDEEKKKLRESEHYASVVSGMGGAFLHPSQTDVGEIEEQVLYPSKKESIKATTRPLFDLVNIIRGGNIWLVGAIAALVVCFAATVPDSSRSATNFFLGFFPGDLEVAAPNSGILDWLRDNTFQLKAEHDPMADLITEDLRKGMGTVAFIYSVSIVFCLMLAGVAFYRAYRQRESIVEEAKKGQIEPRHYRRLVAWYIVAIFAIFVGIWFFGQFSAAVVLSDLTFLLFSAVLFAGLVTLAPLVGGAYSKGTGKIGFLLLGLWHGFLQVGMPFYIAKFAHPLVLVPVAISTFIFMRIGAGLAGSNRRGALVVAFVLAGGLQFAWPTLLSSVLPPPPSASALYPLLVATLLGGTLSCVWFGWYLAVSLAFNGHNNEAGGAARVEEFKQFIRFKVEDDKLTGYVIGFDDPKVDGRELKPRIIDCFTLVCKDSADPQT